MKLREMSESYKLSERLLRERVRQLRERMALGGLCDTELLRLRRRIAALSAMRREMAELAALTEHYYERSSGKNGKYSI